MEDGAFRENGQRLKALNYFQKELHTFVPGIQRGNLNISFHASSDFLESENLVLIFLYHFAKPQKMLWLPPPPYENQSIDLHTKPIYWFLCNGSGHHNTFSGIAN